MSEFLSTKQQRQEKLKELIKRLHDGAGIDEVQDDFRKLTDSISPTEITELEQALVDEGMPISEIQRLCDVHASVFKGSIEDIHIDNIHQSEFIEGHPVHTLKAENKAIMEFLSGQLISTLESYTEDLNDSNKRALQSSVTAIAQIDKHYSRKENLIFPIMEKYDITAPPQVMWGVDDEIRDMIKAVLSALESSNTDKQTVKKSVEDFTAQIEEMIFKEEEIMIPMVLDIFSDEDWIAIEESSADIGYTMIPEPKRLEQEKNLIDAIKSKAILKSGSTDIGMVAADSQTKIKFDAGSLTSEELNSILNTVPIDMTFVGVDNKVRYFTQGKERVFERPLTIIGRQVKHCHPPKSVHIVEGIIGDLRSGKKDNEDFWIRMGDVFVYIRYFAVRNKKDEYLGVLEVTQNIQPITELEGEKRLVE